MNSSPIPAAATMITAGIADNLTPAAPMYPNNSVRITARTDVCKMKSKYNFTVLRYRVGCNIYVVVALYLEKTKTLYFFLTNLLKLFSNKYILTSNYYISVEM